MKKMLLFLLFSTALSAQNYIELRLLNADIGAGVYDGMGIPNTHSTDIALDAILQNYGTTAYIGKYGHPLASYSGRIMSVNFSGNTNQFLAELNAYTAVVEHAQTGNFDYFSDALLVQINDAQVGIPTDIANNIIVTNDEGLNAIFETYHVYFYERAFPGAINENLQRVYNLACDCNNALLKVALDNYNLSVSEYMSATYLLDKKQFNAEQASIYPNPFTTGFTIDTKQNITRYAMFDLSGKQLVDTDSKTTLDNSAYRLESGIYLLELETANGQSIQQKLIKR